MPDLSLTEMYRIQACERKLQAAGYRVIDDPWVREALARTLPPVAYPTPNLNLPPKG